MRARGVIQSPVLVGRDSFLALIEDRHGTPVPGWVLSGPTVDLIRAEPNIEVRRSAIERLGWDAYIRDAALTLVASCPDPGDPGAELRL